MSQDNLNIKKLNEILLTKSLLVEKSVLAFLAKSNTYETVELETDISEKELDDYEILTNRFSRAVETILRYFVSIELKEYGVKSPTIREMLSKMEKNNFIKSTNKWLNMRLSRNKISHEYIENGLLSLANEILSDYVDELKYTYKKIMQYASEIEKD